MAGHPLLDEAILSYIVKTGDLRGVAAAGISVDHFFDEYQTVWMYLQRHNRDHGTVPSRTVVLTRFPDLNLPRSIRADELPILVTDIRKRKTYIDFMHMLGEAVSGDTDYSDVTSKVQSLVGQLNSLAFRDLVKSNIVDLFASDTTDSLVKDVLERRSNHSGIPTGLATVDRLTGGLHPKQSVVVMGRTGLGKSWIDLLFVKSAVTAGKKVVLYPLEMSLEETAFRLYTLFSASFLGADKVLKNWDLQRGKTNTRTLRRFLKTMEDKFEGQLLIADVGEMEDPYTIERIEAEVEIHQPDMFWIDYITLVKPTGGAKDESDHIAIRRLSHGVKQIAMRRQVVGGCSAQVNREAIKAGAWLPRVEHISFGDSIGQDADKVFSIGRLKDELYYALVKNRGGVEIKKQKLVRDFNQGILADDTNWNNDDDD